MNKIEKFKNYYKEVKKDLDKLINNFNKDIVNDDNKILKDNLELFAELNSNGKLVRGTLVNLGYYLLKDNKEYSNYLSVAYEVFQTAILVHDDVIDNDEKRRGKDTIHYANMKKYSKYDENVRDLGNNIAICMGNYGLYLSNQLISKNYCNDPNLGKVLNCFNDTVLKTAKGELLDVILPFQGKHNLLKASEIEKYIIEIFRLKTAHYTIVGPMSVGLLLAGAEEEKLKEIEEFGEKIGIAFQIQDDILGIYSDAMEKNKDSDIKEFKQTILYSHIINTKYKEEFLKYYGNDNLKENDIEIVKDLFKKSGSYDYANDMMNKYYDEGLKVLNSIKWINKDKKDLLEGFVEYLRVRNK